MSAIRQRIVFSGRVQGVFFRATSAEIAQHHPVTGYVRNLPDGSVEMEVQGEASAVEAFLIAVQDRYAENIRNCERSNIAIVSDEQSYYVRY